MENKIEEFYFLFTINLNREFLLYSHDPGTVILGRVYDSIIESKSFGNYNGEAIAIDNIKNGLNYNSLIFYINKISKNKIEEIKKERYNIILAGYIITKELKIETTNITNLKSLAIDFNISKYFEIKKIKYENKIYQQDIKYQGLDIDNILRDIKLNTILT